MNRFSARPKMCDGAGFDSEAVATLVGSIDRWPKGAPVSDERRARRSIRSRFFCDTLSSVLNQALRAVVLLLAILLNIGARADSIVVFNEIMYHPAVNEPALEWV